MILFVYFFVTGNISPNFSNCMTVKLVFDLTCLIKKEIDQFRKYKTDQTLKLTPKCNPKKKKKERKTLHIFKRKIKNEAILKTFRDALVCSSILSFTIW